MTYKTLNGQGDINGIVSLSLNLQITICAFIGIPSSVIAIAADVEGNPRITANDIQGNCEE
tara:strand:- start:691 stop:873 length:183 start_codon:yes stop_codon:yes gene_type:complete